MNHTRRIKIIIGFVLIFWNCLYDITQPNSDYQMIDKNYKIIVKSEDPILQKHACTRLYLQNMNVDCGTNVKLPERSATPPKELNNPDENGIENLDESAPEGEELGFLFHKVQYVPLDTTEPDVFELEIKAEIKTNSLDYLLNLSGSLISLTTGAFMSTSGMVFYKVTLKYQNTVVYDSSIPSEGRVGYWAILPFYMGLVATHIGTALNAYRQPIYLQENCIVSKMEPEKEFWEQSKEGYCKDYSIFIQDSFAKIERKLLNLLRVNILTLYYHDNQTY